jgi:hypothetical protein
MALALVPLPTRAAVDETTAPTLTAITGAQRRLGVTYSSGRVIERARRFRREYSGQATSYVREFDDQLRTALP